MFKAGFIRLLINKHEQKLSHEDKNDDEMTKNNEMKIFWRAQSQLKLIRLCRKTDEFGSESLCAIRLDVHIWFVPGKHYRFVLFCFFGNSTADSHALCKYAL